MSTTSIVCYCGTTITDSTGLVIFERFLQSYVAQVVPINMYMSIYSSNIIATLNVLSKYETLAAGRLKSNITGIPVNNWNYLSRTFPTSTAFGNVTWILFDDGYSIWESTRTQVLYSFVAGVAAQTCIYTPVGTISTLLSEQQIEPVVSNGSLIVNTNMTDNSHFMLKGPYSNYPVTGELNVYLGTQIAAAYKPTITSNVVWMVNRVAESTYGVA